MFRPTLPEFKRRLAATGDSARRGDERLIERRPMVG